MNKNLAANELLTVREVAEFLRMNPITVYRMVQEGQIPSLKINSRWRFRVSSIEKWLEEKEANNGKPNGKPLVKHGEAVLLRTKKLSKKEDG